MRKTALWGLLAAAAFISSYGSEASAELSREHTPDIAEHWDFLYRLRQPIIHQSRNGKTLSILQYHLRLYPARGQRWNQKA